MGGARRPERRHQGRLWQRYTLLGEIAYQVNKKEHNVTKRQKSMLTGKDSRRRVWRYFPPRQW